MKIYWTDLSEIDDCLIDGYRQKLKPNDAKRYYGISDSVRQNQFLIGRMLIYEKCGESPQLTPSGKPILSHGFISLTHSQNLVVLVVSDNPVGIDIENQTKVVPFIKIANRLHFTLDKSNISLSFYRQFTQYEADFKCGKADILYHHFFTLNSDYIGCVSFPHLNEPIEILKAIPYL